MNTSAAQRAIDRMRPETAWEAYFPNRNHAWDTAKVGHLYRRAAFGATWDQIQRGVDQSPDDLVAELLRGGTRSDQFESEIRQLEIGVLEANENRPLQAIWMHRLLSSPHPLRERMTLFWHDHFATSNAKVNSVRLMAAQNATLRTHALGHFDDLLQAMTRDPAMLVWLDSDTNRKGAPNENYAREIFELFGLGEGHYSEQDIQEAARAMTGWSVQREHAVFTPEHFDDGQKTIFAQTGPFAAGDVVRLVLGQPACARFLVRKLFGEFISESVDPPDHLINPLAEEFRQRNYDISWLIGRMLRSWVFYSPAAIRQRIKSPVEFVVGTVRTLGGRVSPSEAAAACEKMGQSLYYPPSVKGWDGGDRWINSSTLLQRQNLSFELTRGTGASAACDPARLALDEGLSSGRELVEFFLNLFQQDVDPRSVDQIEDQLRREHQNTPGPFGQRAALVARARTAAHLVLTMPEYQLG